MSLQESIPEALQTKSELLARPPVSRKDLLAAIQDQGVFDKLYVDLTNRAIKAYQSSRRKRCALKLHASLAALEE